LRLHYIVPFLCRFIEENDEGCGWIVKTPFSTNSHNKKFAFSLDEIVQKIKIQYDDLYHSIPYTMVQATMENKKEYKIVFFNCEPRYVSLLPNQGAGKAFSSAPHTDLLKFAESASREFSAGCPLALVGSLMRVDIFQTKSGKLVVNELESLEADHHCPNRGIKKAMVDDEIRQYYETLLKNVLHQEHFKMI